MTKKAYLFTKVLWLFAGGLLLLNGLLMLFLANFSAGTVFTFFLGVILSLYGIFSRRLPKVLRILFWCLLAVGVVFVVFLLLYGSIDTVTYKEDAIIVLGAGINGEEPSNSLKKRLDAAYEYHRQNPTALIVLSGGQGKDEEISESLAMKRYLLAKGIPEDKLIEEALSTSTRENFSFSKAILDSFFDAPYQIALVTNDYHVYRAQAIAEDIGFLDVTHTSGATPWFSAIPSWLRECAAVLRLWLLGI